jgi:hypothetical protein
MVSLGLLTILSSVLCLTYLGLQAANHQQNIGEIWDHQKLEQRNNNMTKQDVKKAARDHITAKWQNRWNFSNRVR